MEAGSQNFNNDYSFKKTYDENEWNACIKYRTTFPKTDFRPYDIEQRNEKRRQLGINGNNPASTFIFQKDSLSELTKIQTGIWRRYTYLSDTLNYYSDKTLKEINCQATDNLVSERQFYQYKKLTEVIDGIKVFSSIKGSSQDTISLAAYNKRYCNFELERNYEMAKNIVEYLTKYNGKKIVVLTGFYHRYAILDLLRFKQMEYGFELKEFYE